MGVIFFIILVLLLVVIACAAFVLTERIMKLGGLWVTARKVVIWIYAITMTLVCIATALAINENNIIGKTKGKINTESSNGPVTLFYGSMFTAALFYTAVFVDINTLTNASIDTTPFLIICAILSVGLYMSAKEKKDPAASRREIVFVDVGTGDVVDGGGTGNVVDGGGDGYK